MKKEGRLKRFEKITPKYKLSLVGIDGKNVMVSKEDTVMAINDQLYIKLIENKYKPLSTKYDFIEEYSDSFKIEKL